MRREIFGRMEPSAPICSVCFGVKEIDCKKCDGLPGNEDCKMCHGKGKVPCWLCNSNESKNPKDK